MSVEEEPDKKEGKMNEAAQSDSEQADWIDELYAEGQEELPPPVLDARIQAAARAPVKHPWYSRMGRLTTLATAASLVIAAMIIYYVPEEYAPEEYAPEEAQAPVSESLMRISDAPDPANAPADTEADQDRAESPAEPGQTEAGMRQLLSTEGQILREQELPRKPAPQADIVGSGAVAQSPQPVAPARESKKAERYRIATDELAELRANQRFSSEAALESASTSPAVAGAELDADVQAALAELCGPLPGTVETRSLNADALDWYLMVTVGGGSDQRYWRCQDGAWIELDEPVFELPSEEQ